MGETLDNAVDPDVTSHAVDFTWRFFCLVLVLLLQGGFASYEVGLPFATSTSPNSRCSMLLKSPLGAADVCVCSSHSESEERLWK